LIDNSYLEFSKLLTLCLTNLFHHNTVNFTALNQATAYVFGDHRVIYQVDLENKIIIIFGTEKTFIVSSKKRADNKALVSNASQWY